MNFWCSWPKESGWYWYVDLEYPIPKIGFVDGTNKRLYEVGVDRCYKENDILKFRQDIGIRIGDKLDEPDMANATIMHQGT